MPGPDAFLIVGAYYRLTWAGVLTRGYYGTFEGTTEMPNGESWWIFENDQGDELVINPAHISNIQRDTSSDD